MLVDTASNLGLDGNSVGKAIEEAKFADRIERDVDGGVQSGVHATPTFFINGEQFEGPWKVDELVAAIDRAM